MSTINLDVMKQLLQEFVEKETLASEEIKVVQQQIDELEGRIKGCREKLKIVNEDREKIMAMAQRYAGGKRAPSPGDGNTAKPKASEASKPSPASAPEPAKAPQDATPPGTADKGTSDTQTITGNLPEVVADSKLSIPSEA